MCMKRQYIRQALHVCIVCAPSRTSAPRHVCAQENEWIALASNRIRAPTENFDEPQQPIEDLFFVDNMLMPPGSARY